MASSPNDTPPEKRRLRLLLDQGFPKPPRFNLEDVDSSIEAVHLYDFDRSLSENSTPDWYLYCRAAEEGLDALVTRDFSLTEKNFRDPVQTLGEAASDRGISVDQVRREARQEVTDWLDVRGELDRFSALLQFGA